MSSMRPIPVVGALAAVLIVTGCAATSTPSEDPVEPGATQEPVTAGDADSCLIGTWELDLPDYVSQAAEYLKSVGIPLESLDASGTQQVSFTRNELSDDITVTTDMDWNASIRGITIGVPVENVGQGEWTAGDGDRIDVANWSWVIEAEVAPESAPTIPLIDPSTGVTAVCSGDTLTLRGDSAPLVGRFVRAD